MASTQITKECEKNATEELLVQDIYNDILKDMCVDVACEIHGLTSSIPSLAMPPSRKEVYPQIYDSADDIEEKLERYATEQPLVKRFKPNRELLQLVDGDEGSPTESVENNPTNDRVTRHQQNHTDIWGRIPPKEPKEMTFCSICSRHVSVVRFAPHLDKCMGIGTTTRAATTTARPLSS
jgi:Sgf11 (transcriptional regulation protein)